MMQRERSIMKKRLVLAFSRLLFGPFLARKGLRIKRPSLGLLTKELERKVGVDEVTRRYLLYFLLPVWIVAGLLDWYNHRRTKIEQTAGTHESLTHILAMSEVGLPIMMGLFLDVNAQVLLMMIAGFLAHEGTTYWDVAYAQGRREVTPAEQHVHSYLEGIPFMVTSIMICLNWDQFLALFGRGKERPRFELRRTRRPLARGTVRGILAALGLGVALPYAEEFWRCYRHDRTLEPHPPAKKWKLISLPTLEPRRISSGKAR
jgi:hypothetical protein